MTIVARGMASSVTRRLVMSLALILVVAIFTVLSTQTTSLFHLIHLRRLNLADNHFNFSRIPPSISQLSRLWYLNLSDSMLFGQVPLNIWYMSWLSSLDLSWNIDKTIDNVESNVDPKNLLQLNNPNVRSLVQNST